MNALIQSKKPLKSNNNICIQLTNLVPYNIARVQGLIDIGFNCKCLLSYESDSFKPLTSNNHNLNTHTINDKNIIYKTLKTIFYICNNNFDVVFVSGYLNISSLASIFGAFISGSKIILFSESQENDKLNRKSIVEFYKKLILNIFDAAVVGGKSHKDYLSKLGMNKYVIFKGYDCVDNEYFLSKSKAIELSKERIFYLCTVCRFVKKKNLFNLVISYKKFQDKFPKYKNAKLKIAGSGPLREILNLKIKNENISSVELVGPISYIDLPKFYSESKGMLLLSTSEQWGLVTNEALNCGIPVLISERCGSKELIKEDINGYIVNPNDINSISLKIKNLVELSNKEDTKSKCRESISKLNTFNFSNSCLKASMKSQKKKFKLLGFFFITILLFLKNFKITELQKFEA